MSRYIDADMLYDVISDNYAGIQLAVVSDILEMIDNEPSADVIKAARSKWTYDNRGKLMCAACGFHPEYSHYTRDGYSNCNLCPNCGADMRKE